MVTKGLARQVYCLVKNISSLSLNQANISHWDPDDTSRLEIDVCPSDGYYRGAKFNFVLLLDENFPEKPPSVFCKTPIYHPNIDVTDDDEDGYPVCLSMFDKSEWSNKMGLDECVIGLLYLLHNPNLEDPLSPWFSSYDDEEEFKDNVQKSLDGEVVDEFQFERNKDHFSKTMLDSDSETHEMLVMLNNMDIHDVAEMSNVEQNDKNSETEDDIVSYENDAIKRNDKMDSTSNQQTSLTNGVTVFANANDLNKPDGMEVTMVEPMRTKSKNNAIQTVMRTFLYIAETFFSTPNFK